MIGRVPPLSIGSRENRVDRQNNFDLLRLVAATLVMFSHAFLLAENSQQHDPLMLLTGGQAMLGVVGVFVFFTISGYLVTQSFDTTRSPLIFLAKRALRIFPGLFVCLVVCVFVVGPLVTGLPLAEYFSHPTTYLFLLHNAVLHVDYNRLPGVEFWRGDIGGIVNGPLWSLPCEAMMYLMLFGLGVARLLTLAMTALLLAVGLGCLWLDVTDALGGALWLLGFFAAGICLYRLRNSGFICGRGALIAGIGMALSVPAGLFVVCFPLFGAYLVIWFALSRRIRPIPAARFGDLSYGLYIYGWPIEQCVVWLSEATAPWWEVFVMSLAIAAPTALLSWHLVEKRCRWRRRRGASEKLAAGNVSVAG